MMNMDVHELRHLLNDYGTFNSSNLLPIVKEESQKLLQENPAVQKAVSPVKEMAKSAPAKEQPMKMKAAAGPSVGR